MLYKSIIDIDIDNDIPGSYLYMAAIQDAMASYKLSCCVVHWQHLGHGIK